MLSDLHER